MFLGVIAGISVGVVGLYALLYWLARRRRTPNWQLDRGELPQPENLLPTLAGLAHSRIYPACSVRIFRNGTVFDAMLDDIAAARHTVHLETYIWESGAIEQRFVQALIEARERGVTVRMIVDGVGSFRRSDSRFRKLRDSGVRLHLFSPLALASLWRFNERTHRKLLIVDGAVAFTMGHGFSDKWLGNAEDSDHYRDTAVRLRGPCVHGLQAVFLSAWAAERHELVTGAGVFPDIDGAGPAGVAVVASNAGDYYSNVEVAFTLAIAMAKREILIQNPYFAPDQNVVQLLCDAAKRGVSVCLMLPGAITDSYLLRLAARYLYPQLLDAGVTLLEYEPTLLHQKVMVVDGVLSRIGSTNLDSRSLEINAEAGVVILDRDVAAELKAHFEEDRRVSRAISSDDLKKAPVLARFWTAAIYLFRAHL